MLKSSNTAALELTYECTACTITIERKAVTVLSPASAMSGCNDDCSSHCACASTGAYCMTHVLQWRATTWLLPPGPPLPVTCKG